MFTYIERRDEVTAAQRALSATIAQAFTRSETRDIGFPGGTELGARIKTDGRYWYWTADLRDVPNPRRLNWFGIYKGDARHYLYISVEMNAAYKGRNDSVAGFFGRDTETGAVYLFHSGRIGGGTKGVGKDAFLAWSSRRPDVIVDSSGNPRLGVLVMAIEGVGATGALTRYIDAIATFKAAVREGPLDGPEFTQNKHDLDRYYSEARGRRRGRRSAVTDYLSRHGEVVDALRDWRIKRPLPRGARIVKNVLIDMGVRRGNELAEVYEVKTSVSRSDIYSGIGQLMVHGALSTCKRFIVLPSNQRIAADLSGALQRLQIKLLRFHLEETKALIQ